MASKKSLTSAVGAKGKASLGTKTRASEFAKSYSRALATSYARGGLAGDMSVAVRNAGALATPQLARAAGYQRKPTEAAIAAGNRVGRMVGNEMSKNMLMRMAGPIAGKGIGKVAGGTKAARTVTRMRGTKPVPAPAPKAPTSVTAKDIGGMTSRVSKRTGGVLKEGEPMKYGPKKPTPTQRQQMKQETATYRRKQTIAAKKAAGQAKPKPAPPKKAAAPAKAVAKKTAKGPGRK